MAAPATAAGFDAAVLFVVGVVFGAVLLSIKVAPAGAVVVSFVGNSCVGVVIRLVAVTTLDGMISPLVDAGPDVVLRVL